ncbi:dentin sialophosphoprotein isoform X2 [Parasteatoda tepidariorum]|uniref:dentin sialophosphoprotein isoform X2 n=1 Tax=Parasteatoda tepidariorum TaxID=114398 RepID=UPI0039BC511F
MSQGSRMPDYQIPDIFHRFQGWMEVREQVMEGLSKGLWKTSISSAPSTLHSEELNFDTTSELSASKRKPEEQFQKSKKTLRKSQECKDDDDEEKELYAELEYLENLLNKTGGKKLAEQKHLTKQRIFNEFFTKWRNSHSNLHEERKNKTGENINDRLNIILNVLKENKEPALEEWMKACEENDVGQIGGSASRNYSIFKKDNYVHEMRDMRKKSSEKDLPQPSTSFQQDDSFYYFPGIHYPGRNKEDALDWSEISPVLDPHEEVDCQPDSGMILDSGVVPDSGAIPDSGMIIDSGVIPDSGVVLDSGVVPDSGAVPDSGVVLDSGVIPDSGAVPDSVMIIDSGVIPDSGAIPDSGMIIDSGVIPDSGMIIDSGVVPDSGAVPDSGVVPDSGSVPDSGVVPDSGLLSESLDDHSVPDRNAKKDSSQPLTIIEQVLFSYLRDPFGDPVVPDRNLERDSENLSTSTHPAEISFLRDLFGDLFISDRNEDSDSENLSTSPEPAESCLIEDDENSIDFDLLSKWGLEKKSATETVAQSDGEDLRKNTASSSSVKPVYRDTEVFYTFAGKIQKEDVVGSEILQPFDELAISSNSEDETDEEQHLSDTEAVESGTETESTDSDSMGTETESTDSDSVGTETVSTGSDSVVTDVDTENMNECNVNTENTKSYISPLNIIINDPKMKQIFVETPTMLNTLNTDLDERSIVPISSESESPRSDIVSECY